MFHDLNSGGESVPESLNAHAPVHAEHPLQSDHVHFVAHFVLFEAHQLWHNEISHLGSIVVEPTVLANLPGGHLLWATHFSLGQPIDQTNAQL